MALIKKRVMIGILGLALTFALVACDPDDGPPDTPSPGDSDTTTTEPVGS